MAKNENNLVPTESDTWNVGKGFSATHILVPLMNCQRYLDLCNRGVEDIMDLHFVDENIITRNKINAMDSFLKELQKIISNTKFTMDKRNLKAVLKIKISLDSVAKKFPSTYFVIEDQRTYKISYKLNENIYNSCLTSLINALEEIKKPLNAKNLIFPSSGGFDLEKLKEEVMEMG